MKDPLLIFEDTLSYITFIKGSNTEGQFFDRKEVLNTKKSLDEVKYKIQKCISAFANSRGGVLILGIEDSGIVVGLEHLGENEYNSLAQTTLDVLNHSTQTKEMELEGHKILLFYTPVNLSGVCKTVKKPRRGWKREGANCLDLTLEDETRLILERSKKYESLLLIEADAIYLNQDVLKIFKQNTLLEGRGSQERTDEEFLKMVGAYRTDNGITKFTNAGWLFLASNPKSEVPSAYIRFLKYDCEYKDFRTAGNPIFDKVFDGCIPDVLQKIRAFIGNSAIFKKYSYRDPNGSGIVEELEYPLTAVEEAIVNAIVHRDYNVPQPILCSVYRDAFVVRNPGGIRQPSFIPDNFELGVSEPILEHYPRNPKLMDWVRIMKDENGQRFVKALSEGTKSMLQSMLDMGLPAPKYHTNGFTTVGLFNNYKQREARFKALENQDDIDIGTEFSNLYPVNLDNWDESEDLGIYDVRNMLFNLLKDKLQNSGWFIDKDRASRITAHKSHHHLALSASANKYVRIYPAYTFQLHVIGSKLYLSIDYDIQVKNVANIETLFNLGIKEFRHRPALAKVGDIWTHGTIENGNEHYTNLILREFEQTKSVMSRYVIPTLSLLTVKAVLQKAGVSYDIDTKIKEFSLASKPNASKERFRKIEGMARTLSEDIFPINNPHFKASLEETAQFLYESKEEAIKAFKVLRIPKEPSVRFNENAVNANIGEGLTKFGSYQNEGKKLEIIPICERGYEGYMEQLLSLIKNGSYRFKGMERTFRVKPVYTAIIAKTSASEYLDECKRLVTQHPDWSGSKGLERIFLVHIPEDKYPVTNDNSPYYQVKEYLFEVGIPVQMIDSSTLRNPRFKDLNLSLNIVAKTGGVPWVLPNQLPDVDFFIGLSYTQYKDNDRMYRTMGYANVFNEYGRWQYYKGNSKAFNYNDKHIHLSKLIEETLQNLPNLTDSPALQIHYSSKFSKKDRGFISKAVWKVRPNAKIIFVWLNIGHNIRLFDNRIEGNGSLSRGSYVLLNDKRFYVSTTGYSPMKKTFGSPVMLEINVTQQGKDSNSLMDLKNIAWHILALTKLNWSSTQSISGQPVTIKYARNIARLSAVFMKRNNKFNLHPVLEQTPWFI